MFSLFHFATLVVIKHTNIIWKFIKICKKYKFFFYKSKLKMDRENLLKLHILLCAIYLNFDEEFSIYGNVYKYIIWNTFAPHSFCFNQWYCTFHLFKYRTSYKQNVQISPFWTTYTCEKKKQVHKHSFKK